MAIELTDTALFASEATGKTPVLVLKFDNSDTLYGPVTIKKFTRVGDPGLLIGDSWTIGSTTEISDQKPYVNLSFSTSTIRQQIEPDRGSGSSISSMKIRLIDFRQEITQLITPGIVFTDPLGQRATVWFGFQESAWQEDYFVAFKGIVESFDSGPGWIDISLNSPDDLKRQTLFDKFSTLLNGTITSSTTSITFIDDPSFMVMPSDIVRSFVRIDDEFIEFTGVSGLSLTGVTRGALFTTNAKAIAASHTDGASADAFYIIEGNPIDSALKLMLSGIPGDYASGFAAQSFTSDTIEFPNIFLVRDHNVSKGDLISITGATNPANNITLQPILLVNEDTAGTTIEIDGATFITELGSSAVAAFKSKYNTLNEGVGMLPVDVDIAKHEDMNETFIASYQARSYIEDSIKFKDFLEQELYNPFGIFSLPRQGKASAGLHIPPLPGNELIILDQDNIKSPNSIVLTRSSIQNFQNSIVYKFDKDLYEDKYRKGEITFNNTSIVDIGKRKDYTIASNGLRSDLAGSNIVSSVSTKRLERYNRGAESIKGLKLTLKTGLQIEPGDVIILKTEGLQISNTIDGDRNRPTQLWEVVNREFNLKGEVFIDLVQTNYNSTNRYGQISPASKIASGSTTSLILKSSYQSRLGSAEYRKWNNFLNAQVVIRSFDYSVSGLTTISSIDDNLITLGTALSFTPLLDYIMEFSSYDTQTNLESENVKLIYGFITNGTSLFADGGQPYRMI